MPKENSTRLPEAEYDESGNRKDLTLGKNHDETFTVLPGYVDIDGVWVHPSRVEDYLRRQQELKK